MSSNHERRSVILIQRETRSGVSNPWVVYGLIFVVASVLRAYHLDGQLWFDEISALRGYRKSFIEILTTFPPYFPNPLYELMAHLGIVTLGENALAIRLPSALFGVAGVLMFYRLTRRCLGPAEALLAGALLAVSFHHISYSQDARGYTTYLFFGLLATDRLLALFDSMRWRTSISYVASVALATYAHAFGIFILIGQMMIALPLTWWRRRNGTQRNPTPAQITGTAALGALATVLLYSPLIVQSLNYALTEATSEGHGPRVLDLLPELFEGLIAGFGGWPGLIFASLIGVLGMVDLLRRHPLIVFLLGAPVAVSAVGIAALGAGIHPRYFLFALPLGYLVGTRGFMLLVQWVLQRFHRLGDARAIRVQWALGVFAVAVACIPLVRYYSMPKQDFLGAIHEVRSLAGPHDRIVAADLAGIAIAAYYEPDIDIVTSAAELLEIEASARKVWVITTLERGMHTRAPAMLVRLKDHYEQIRWLPGSMGDGDMRIYAGPQEPSNE